MEKKLADFLGKGLARRRARNPFCTRGTGSSFIKCGGYKKKGFHELIVINSD